MNNTKEHWNIVIKYVNRTIDIALLCNEEFSPPVGFIIISQIDEKIGRIWV